MSIKDDDEGEREEKAQRREEWAGTFRDEHSRILWRIENKLDQHGGKLAELKEEGKGRDQRLREVQQRQKDDYHKLANNAQLLSNEVRTLQVTSDTTNKQLTLTSVQLDGLDKRVTGLDERMGHVEAPLKEALALKEKRRAKMSRFWIWSTAVLGFLWTFGEPIWKALAPAFVQRLFSGPHL